MPATPSTKSNFSDTETEPTSKKAKNIVKATLPDRDALPARDDHPALRANVIPPTWHTKQVDAEHEAVQNTAKEEVGQGEPALRLLTEMQVLTGSG